MIALSDYLIVGAILFSLSVAGIFLNRKNVLIADEVQPGFGRTWRSWTSRWPGPAASAGCGSSGSAAPTSR